MRNLQKNNHNLPGIVSSAVIAMALAFGIALAARPATGAADDEAAIRDVITRHAAAHETGDLAAIEKLWVHDDTATVAEGGSFNYGWTDFRDHHLRPEIEAMKNVKFPIEDIKVHVKGNLAWTTYSYRMSGEYKGRQFDSAGAATMALENGTAHGSSYTNTPARNAARPLPRSRRINNRPRAV